MGSNKIINKENLDNEISIFKKIEEILNGKIKIGDLILMKEKNGFSKTIGNILDKYSQKQLFVYILEEVDSEVFKKHKEFHDDFEIVKIAVQKDSKLFGYISTPLKNDLQIGIEVIKSMVRENKNLYDIEIFINNNFLENAQELFDFYFDYIQKLDDLLKDDLTKILLNTRKTDKKLYNLFKKSSIFKSKGKNIVINNDFISRFVNEFKNDKNFHFINQLQKDQYIYDKLKNYLIIDDKQLSNELKMIFNLVIKLINIENIKQIKENKKNEDLNEKKLLNNKKKSNSTQDIVEEKNEKDNGEDIKILLDFTYPEYSYSIIPGGYNIETNLGKKIFISDDEKDNFTSIAFKNYIKFITTLNNLGLNFLWDKYQKDFKILCDNKFGFNHINGEGISEFKLLSVLNLIGRNIGIPEYVFQDEKGDDIKEIKCFKTLGDAKLAFEDIKDSGKINDIRYCDNSMFGKGAVENKLIEVLCIDQKGNGLNISKWK